MKLGVVMPAELRAKISAGMMGHKGSTKAGWHLSDASRLKMGAAHWKGGAKVSHKRRNAKHRTLGYNPLNSWFAGCVGHHYSKLDVIYMPRLPHCSVNHNQWTGRGMAEINAIAGAFLTEDWT